MNRGSSAPEQHLREASASILSQLSNSGMQGGRCHGRGSGFLGRSVELEGNGGRGGALLSGPSFGCMRLAIISRRGACLFAMA